MGPEQDNLRAAVDWNLSPSNPIPLEQRLNDLLKWVLSTPSFMVERIQWIEKALSLIQADPLARQTRSGRLMESMLLHSIGNLTYFHCEILLLTKVYEFFLKRL